MFLPCYHLTCACWASFGLAVHFPFTQFPYPSTIVGLVLTLFRTSLAHFIPFGASLTHFIPLGILGPLHSLKHPRPIPILHSYGLLLSLLDFPGPNYHILYFRGLLAFPPTLFTSPSYRILRTIFACFLFLIMPIGLLLLSLGSLWPACFIWGPFTILQAHGPLFLPFGLNGFPLTLLILLLYSLPYCWASSYYWASLLKWASTHLFPQFTCNLT